MNENYNNDDDKHVDDSKNNITTSTSNETSDFKLSNKIVSVCAEYTYMHEYQYNRISNFISRLMNNAHSKDKIYTVEDKSQKKNENAGYKSHYQLN